ncbi:MAG TPA: hypothetical protein VFS00_17850, partial [Polyangiaceae bacterium]|nr:hypothetical protein [Polyangiaceae bacterium]
MISSLRIGLFAASLLAVAAGGCGRAADGGPAPGGAPAADAPAAPALAAKGAAVVAAPRVPVDGAPATGAATAPLTVVAFNDFECPFSKRGDAMLAELRAEFGDRLPVVLLDGK